MKPTIISLFAFVLALAISAGSSAQEKPDQGKDEQTITLKIVKDDNGKVTVIDTTITTKGEGKSLQYEYVVKDCEKDMSGLEDQMRDLEYDMQQFKVIKAPHGEMFIDDGNHIQRFNWNEDCEDVFMPRPPMSPQLESLLQSIPMGNIIGFQIKDRKDGKRIIIDIDDESPVIIMAPYRHSGRNMGEKKVIIEREMDDMQIPPPPPPPPPPAEEEKPAPKPEKG